MPSMTRLSPGTSPRYAPCHDFWRMQHYFAAALHAISVLCQHAKKKWKQSSRHGAAQLVASCTVSISPLAAHFVFGGFTDTARCRCAAGRSQLYRPLAQRCWRRLVLNIVPWTNQPSEGCDTVESTRIYVPSGLVLAIELSLSCSCVRVNVFSMKD